ncbi:MAG TPA: cyclophilin-like fold protein [Thermodesulfobacteriota bacterium]|nr:cyclophilin-like fold protein [Thermodesulfobacteriota bacterium]
MKRIKIIAGEIEVLANLHETKTASAIWDSLPFRGKVNRWGDEIYFEIPLKLPKEKEAKEAVLMGELGYWPVGHAFCIFFGMTPVSTENEIKAASPVNIFGRVEGNPEILKKVPEGSEIKVEKLS